MTRFDPQENDLILPIAHHLQHGLALHTLSNLALCSKRLYRQLSPYLYHQIIINLRSQTFLSGVLSGEEVTNGLPEASHGTTDDMLLEDFRSPANSRERCLSNLRRVQTLYLDCAPPPWLFTRHDANGPRVSLLPSLKYLVVTAQAVMSLRTFGPTTDSFSPVLDFLLTPLNTSITRLCISYNDGTERLYKKDRHRWPIEQRAESMLGDIITRLHNLREITFHDVHDETMPEIENHFRSEPLLIKVKFGSLQITESSRELVKLHNMYRRAAVLPGIPFSRRIEQISTVLKYREDRLGPSSLSGHRSTLYVFSGIAAGVTDAQKYGELSTAYHIREHVLSAITSGLEEEDADELLSRTKFLGSINPQEGTCGCGSVDDGTF